MSEHQHAKTLNTTDNATEQNAHINGPVSQHTHPAAIIQQARAAPRSMSAAHVLQLQRTIGNRAVVQLLSEIGGRKSAQEIPIQIQGPDEEELQMKVNPVVIQQQEPEKEELMQGKFASGLTGTLQAEEEAPSNRTGMPDHLKSGLENISGMDLSGVRVHYNSSKPKQLNSLAYTQGQEIHVAPGQEKHLPHEGWHAVQQMQGRVKLTMHADGASINDDNKLEQEADQMGAKASRLSAAFQPAAESSEQMKQVSDGAQRQAQVIQRVAPAFLGVSAAAWGVAANVASVVGVATGVAGISYSAATRGESEVGTLVLPANLMSSGDRGKLRQIAHFRIINAYIERYLAVHPEVRNQLDPVYGPPLPPSYEAPAGDGGGGASGGADRPTGAPTASGIDEAVMLAVKDSIETELRTAMETATTVENSTIEFMWGEDDTQGVGVGEGSSGVGVGEGSSGSAESVGVTGFLRFRDLEGSVLTEMLRLSSDARAAIGSVPGEREEMLIHRFIGGSVGGIISRSYIQDLTINVEGGAAQVGVASNGSPKLIVRTHWYWDRLGANVDTYMRNEIHVMDNGTIHITQQREGSPNDEPWA